MRFTRFIPLVLAAGLLAGCAATPQATETTDAAATTAPSASATAENGEITSAAQITTLDEAIAFAATITPDMQSAKYQVVNTAAKLRALSIDAVPADVLATVDAQLVEVGRDATGSATADELAEQIAKLQDAAATIAAAL